MAAHLIVSDEDAADFLQSQFSNDLQPFSAGQSAYGLWLDVKGKIVADSWVVCEGEERFRLFSEHCPGKEIREKLEHHIVADDVELEQGAEVAALAIVGEGLPDPAKEGGAFRFCIPGRRSDLQSYELIFDDAAARSAWIEANECEIVSEGWIQEERMRAGVPHVPGEALPGDLPGEAGLVGDAVSLTKGCFLGQEVVARMHNVGRPQRALYRLDGFGQTPDLQVPVTNEAGKLLGEIRTTVASESGWKGVAMLKSRFVEEGMALTVGEGQAVLAGHFIKGN